MCTRLGGRVAIVTGATGYLGSHHCLHLAREGATVVVADIVDGQPTVDAVRGEGGKAVFMELDVTDQEQAQHVADQTLSMFGRIDVLVNNAGIQTNIVKPWIEFSPEDWDRKLGVDLKGSFICARAVFPAMKAQRYGKIINTASGVMLLGTRNFLTHVSAKAGVIGFTRALATEVGEYDINVNAVIVGGFPRRRPGIPEEVMEQAIQRTLAIQTFKRVADPNDLSRVVVFLASDDSQWITGQAIAVCGGTVRTGG